MDAEWEDLFSIEEIMGGLPSRRASTLLFAIEGLTAQQVARSRRALVRDFSGRTAEQEEQAFLSALTEGAALPVEPAIQDLERYAPAWASLVPDEPSIRAALAHLMAEKYRIPPQRTPRLQAALGLADPATAERYESSYHQPVSSLFVTELTWQERARWLRSRLATRLETLSPFWTAFALTLTETVGAGILALPIAFAELGVLGAVLLLTVLGGVNILTIAALSEAVARNGNIRYGHAYFGRLVNDYLGRPGQLLLTPALMLLMSLVLVAYTIGISSTLSHSIGLSPVVWTFALLAVVLYFLRKDSLDATIATALVIGFTTISLIILLSAATVPHIRSANLRHSEIPFVGGNEFDAGVLHLIFGVVLTSLFGHTTTANCAAIVLERDPSARSLIRGTVAAITAALGLYLGWIVIINGAVEPSLLAGQRGTALEPLSEVVGPGVSVLGAVFVVLAMGMASVHMGWGLANSVGEWLPHPDDTGGGADGANWARFGRTTIKLAPVVAIFVVIALLFVFDRESFAGPLSFLGVLTIPIVAGIFPMLMLTVARLKGDCAVGYAWRILGNPVVVALVSLIFLLGILAHGLVIWDNPLQQAVALIVAAITAVFIVVTARTSFVPRAVAEVRYGQAGESQSPTVSVVARGEPVAGAEVEPVAAENGFASLLPGGGDISPKGVTIAMPPLPVDEMKVWVHRLLPGGVSLPVPARVRVNDAIVGNLDESTNSIVVSVDGGTQRITVEPVEDVSRPGGV
jgi:amino acid permease